MGAIPVQLWRSGLRPEGPVGARDAFASRHARLSPRRSSMSTGPLMPKATAVWLVDNTSLSFDQIADFCKLHPLEVKGIADGEVAAGIKGHDPIVAGQLTREEIAQGREGPELPAQAGRLDGPHARAEAQEGPALHAAVAPPGPSQRHPLAAAQPSGAEGRADHAPRRHDQDHHPADPRPDPLERRDLAPDRPRDARASPRRSTSTSRSRAPPRTARVGSRRAARRCCRPRSPPPRSPSACRSPASTRRRRRRRRSTSTPVFAKLKQLKSGE